MKTEKNSTKSPPGTRNGNQWTEARFHGFVTSALRAASRRWPPKYGVLAESFSGKKTNPKSGREAKHYKCASCHGEFPSSAVQVDHKDPVVNPETGFVSWDEYINRLFCEAENLQVLCRECHSKKSKEEKVLRVKTNSKLARE